MRVFYVCMKIPISALLFCIHDHSGGNQSPIQNSFAAVELRMISRCFRGILPNHDHLGVINFIVQDDAFGDGYHL